MTLTEAINEVRSARTDRLMAEETRRDAGDRAEAHIKAAEADIKEAVAREKHAAWLALKALAEKMDYTVEPFGRFTIHGLDMYFSFIKKVSA